MTQKHLDGVFKDLDIDTQIQKIEGVSAVRLPEVYKDNTLTHNWSISWLVDYLNKNRDASKILENNLSVPVVGAALFHHLAPSIGYCSMQSRHSWLIPCA